MKRRTKIDLAVLLAVVVFGVILLSVITVIYIDHHPCVLNGTC
jgi:hypothetical protein